MADETTLLRGGTIVDGSGSAPYGGSVLVRGDHIVGVDREITVAGADETDVSGMVVAPGIIDMHTHSDVSVLSDPDVVSAIGQGVTTQVVGHCGFSAAPTDEHTRRSLVSEEPVFGFPRPEGDPARPWGWDDTTAYLDAVRAAIPRTNVATMVGHNTIRRLVMGSEDVPVEAGQVDRMRRWAADSLAGGAIGVSTGLSYAPGLFSGREELAAMAGEAAIAGRRYHTHMRYGDLSTRESLAEAIETARLSGAPVNVSHLYPGRNDPQQEAGRLLEMIDEANEDGLEVTFDLTLFRRGGGAWLQGLPPWAREGGLAATVERIRQPAERSRMLANLRGRDPDWDDNLIVKVNREENAGLVGSTIGDIARHRGSDPAETALSLVEEDGQYWVAPTIKRQRDLDLLLTHPSCIPVTDGMAAHPERHRALGLMPKTFGTFPLLLGDYVRDRRVLPLSKAVARVTSAPAERLGLRRRGRIESGWAADLVVFDPEKVANRADDQTPGRAPAGVHHVMVNGRWAMRDGMLTTARSGRVLT